MLASLLARVRARRRIGRQVGIVYHPGYGSDALLEAARAAGADPFRGETILGRLSAEGLLRPGDVRVPRPVSLPTLRLVHSEAYLESVTRPEVLGRIFGLDPGRVPVVALLRAQRLAVGGTVAAARMVTRTTLRVAVNLGGGLHHAEPEQGSGFCVYNDIAVAIALLRQKGLARRVAIVDLDYHQGNGNLIAFAEDPSVLTLSIHGSTWSHVEAVADLSLELPSGTGDRAYLAALEETLLPALGRHGPELVFYLAGNDVLAGDHLGDFKLTEAAVLARDQVVIRACESLGARLVVTLGGGYQPAAVDAWTSLARWLLTGRARVRPISREDPRRRFARVFRRLDPGRLQSEPLGQGGGLDLDLSDVLDDLSPEPPARRFLDFYTLPGIEYALERYGILARIRRVGYRDLRLEGDLRDRGHQILRLFGVGRDDPERRPRLLVELVAHRAKVPAPDAGEAGGSDAPLEVLWIEWLLLQNPLATFTLERPPLPGQTYPGLGISHEILLALVQVCRRLGLDGLLHRPAHYHNAVVGARHFFFLEPEMEGRFRALREVLEGLPLAEATAAVEAGRVRLGEGAGEPLRWDAAHAYLPVSERLRTWFESATYRERSEEARRALLAQGLRLMAPARPDPS